MADSKLGGKRAISPLIATVLLVAFSVALGAVVMSWGEEYVAAKADFVQGTREAISQCDAAAFNIITVARVPQVCFKGTLLQVMLDNGPDAEIYDFNARLVGTQGTFTAESLMNAPLSRLHSVKLALQFPNNLGVVRQVKFVPKVKIGNDIVFCKDKSLTTEDIRQC